jgi:Flp pilus assembly protein TadG
VSGSFLATRPGRAFLRNERGVSAVEFALILPVLVILYLGGVELTQAVTADRKVTAATSAVGDLVAQAQEINGGDIDNIFDAASAILAPYNADGLQVVVSSVRINENGDATVLWSDARNTACHAVGSSIVIPAGVAIPDSTVIVAESEFFYQPIFGQIVTESIRLSDTFYMRPRTVDEVQNPQAVCGG